MLTVKQYIFLKTRQSSIGMALYRALFLLVYLFFFSSCGGGSDDPGDITPPSTPQNLSAAAVSTLEINLSWSASIDENGGIASYIIERSSSTNGNSNMRTTATSYTDSGLTESYSRLVAGERYCYKVSALDWAGNISAYSNQVCATAYIIDNQEPTTPTGLTVENYYDSYSTSERAILSWQPSQDNIKVRGYNIYREGSFLEKSYNVDTNVYADFSVEAETKYCYTISAFDFADNESLLTDPPVCMQTGWNVTMLDDKTMFSDYPYSSMALDSNDNIHIVYIGDYYEYTHIRYISNVSGRWSGEYLDNDYYAISSPPYYGFSIDFDINNIIHILFSGYPRKIFHISKDSYFWRTEELVGYFISGDLSQQSIKVDSIGYLHITYTKSTGVFHSTNASGNWEETQIDSEGRNILQETVIAVDSKNNVHASYYDYLNGDLKYVTNKDGTWEITVIDSIGDVGKHPSIAIDTNDNIHISYYDSTNDILKYASNKTGSWLVEIIDNVQGRGEFSSLAVDSLGNPHVSYSNINYEIYYSDTSRLHYATNESGTWNTEFIVDPKFKVNSRSSIAIDTNDKVHISYFGEDCLRGIGCGDRGLLYATNSLSQ